MAELKVKLIAGVLYPDEKMWKWTVDSLRDLWGEPERQSEQFPFENTDYYKEISPVLYRRFISFGGIFSAGDIVKWKKTSCRLENCSGPKRKINIDPGYINGARLVLASTKDHAHRIYISEGIFAEVTMRFRFGKWVPFDYTFPDFASGRYDDFFEQVRKDWLVHRHQGGLEFDRKI